MMMAVSFQRSGRLYYLDPGSHQVSVGTKVLVPTDAGPEVAECVWAPQWVDDEIGGLPVCEGLAGEEHLRRAEELLRPVGKVLRIPESQQDAATALSGSGPAYVYYLVESMVDAAILRHGARCRAGDGHPGGLRRGHHAP